MKDLNLVGWAIHLAKPVMAAKAAIHVPKPVMAAKAAIHAFPAARHLWISVISGEAKVSGRFFEKKLRKKLLSWGHGRLRRQGHDGVGGAWGYGRLKGGRAAAVPRATRSKNFLRSFFLKKRPLGLSEI